MGVYKCAGRKRAYPDDAPYCSYEAPKRWYGPCPECGGWYDIEPFGFAGGKSKTTLASAAIETKYYPTGMPFLDRVLGGGLVKGSTILFGGQKGSGKTTLLLALADAIATTTGKHVLYASGEQNAADVGRYAHRLGLANENVELIGNANDIYEITERAEELKPFLIIGDSLQVLVCSDVKGDEGSVSQGIAVTNVFTAHCKRTHQCGILVNHLSKSGEFAGSETVGHLVDTVMSLSHHVFEYDEDDAKNFPRKFRYSGEAHMKLRTLTTEKNRNGEADLIEYLEMTTTGLIPVKKKSKLTLVGNEEEDD